MALTLLSCSRNGSNKDASFEWGYTEYYESTSLKKYTPVPMDGVFEIELNNHASQMFKEGGSVTFEVVETREGEELPLQYIDVYTHNGNEEWYLCDGGTVTVNIPHSNADETTTTLELPLRFIFDGLADDGRHDLMLKYKDFKSNLGNVIIPHNGRDKNYSVKDDSLKANLQAIQARGFHIYKKTITNPVTKGITIGVIIFLIGLIVYLCARPLIFPRIKVNNFTAIGPKGTAPINAKIRGYYKAILTPKNAKKQGLLERIFVGKVKYIYAATLQDDITIKGHNSTSVVVEQKPTSPYVIMPTIIDKKVINMRNPAKLRLKATHQEIFSIFIQ